MRSAHARIAIATRVQCASFVPRTELTVEAGSNDTVAGLAVALEIVDTGRPPNGLEEIVAADVYHRAVALGPTRRGATATGGRRAPATRGQDSRRLDLPRAVEPGDHIVAEIDGLGAVAATIAP
jgi:hypothetical protein